VVTVNNTSDNRSVVVTIFAYAEHSMKGGRELDISKAKRPIHIVCPYCKKDLQYNGASIKSQKEGLMRKLDAIQKKYGQTKDPEKRKKLNKEKEEALFKLKLLQEDVHMLSQMSELETLKIFKRNARKYLSNEIYLKLIRDAEQEYLDENTYNYYDLAMQRYNNFEGA